MKTISWCATLRYWFAGAPAAEGALLAADARRRVFSVRFLGDDMRHAPRAWVTSPEFPGLADELPAGAAMEHALFPVVWERAP